ncbi:MAG: rRNA maturation RNase YbeY [Oscillospiraceae bacterium]|jgi:probable rRNA maturation factor|nr:rRNA maturation RNase YbeY [Oscillospiraceae bacterium]
MTRHKIYIKNVRDPERKLDSALIRRAVNVALDAEGVDAVCEVSVVVTSDSGIQAINREFRKIDEPTDVLSFPLQTLSPAAFDARAAEVDLSTNRIPLGDIVLSHERVTAQAAEFGHTRERETAYLTVHSVLHLLGYDHLDEGEEKRQMREREKAIMRLLGYPDEAVDEAV